LNTSIKKIFLIVLFGSVLGLIVNQVNPKGISLIREKEEISWAEDSLFSQHTDSTTETVDKPINSEKKKIDTSVFQVKNETIKSEVIPDSNKSSKRDSLNIIKKEPVVVKFDEPKAINLEQAYKLYKQGILFIDAREPADYKAGHIKNAISIPYEESEQYKYKLKDIPKDQPIVTYCAGTDCELSILLGNELFFEDGYKQVYVFFGGWIDWKNSKYPEDSDQTPEINRNK